MLRNFKTRYFLGKNSNFFSWNFLRNARRSFYWNYSQRSTMNISISQNWVNKNPVEHIVPPHNHKWGWKNEQELCHNVEKQKNGKKLFYFNGNNVLQWFFFYLEISQNYRRIFFQNLSSNEYLGLMIFGITLIHWLKISYEKIFKENYRRKSESFEVTRVD